MQLAWTFLKRYQTSPATYNTYRREVERFLLWCETQAHQSLTQLDTAAIERYLAFCQHPPASWIGDKKVPRFLSQGEARLPNPAWRPFVVHHHHDVDKTRPVYQLHFS